ncbi:MAG: hypothetical protein AAFR93_15460 [Pseudomonadota bacterium]
MPAPIAPIVWTAARIGAVAAIAYYSGRASRNAPKHVWRERALDDTPEGVDLTHQREDGEANAHGSARIKRTVRLSAGGPGLEIDATALTRIRIRRV